jgi:enamine deaminase RidA (YjgF/YER057c/UK114 family)
VDRRVVNPWTWQEQFAFVQANEISGAQHMLVAAGQASVDGDGRPLHPGDMRAQLGQSFDNLETVLREAGYGLDDVVRLNYYTTDVDAFLDAHDVVNERLGAAGCRSAGTLLGVARLAFPELLVEIEATAVR